MCLFSWWTQKWKEVPQGGRTYILEGIQNSDGQAEQSNLGFEMAVFGEDDCTRYL